VKARNAIVGVLFIALLAAAVVLARWAGSGRSKATARESSPPGARSSGEPGGRTLEAPSGATLARNGAPAEQSAGTRRVNEARERLARDILRARERRTEREKSQPAGDGSGSPGERPELKEGMMEKEYIQDRVREIVPLIKECYELALDQKPSLAGKLTVRFTLAGEPEIGGIVESSEIDTESSTISDPGMSECISETMYALEFEPPANGGQVEVRYPFKFRTTEEE